MSDPRQFRPAPSPTVHGGVDPKQANAEARRRDYSRPSLGAFAQIIGALLVLAAICAQFRPSFFPLAIAVIAGFVIHYWLPFRYKEPFWIGLSIIGGTYLAAMATPDSSLSTAITTVGLVLTTGLVMFAIVASPLPYRARLALVVMVLGGVVWAGTSGRAQLDAPPRLYLVFGHMFRLQIFMYLYDVKYFSARASLRDFLRYFFPLPAFKLAGPILDYHGLGKSLYARRIQETALQGTRWIARGMIQYAIYLVLSPKLRYALDASDTRSVYLVLKHLLCAYAGYFQTSGAIHVFVGILKLFGYDLPEPYRWYAFAHSPLDFWRRANIYWKNAMMKVVFFPTYFALRKRGDGGAKIIALLVVFAVSWLFHVWIISWLSDLKPAPWIVLRARPQQALFWASLGIVAAINLWLEIRAESRSRAPAETSSAAARIE